LKEDNLTIQKIENFLKSFIKAAKILHFYPENNPMGKAAVDECLQRIREIKAEKEITIIPAKETLLFEDTPVASDYPGFRQLARQLYVLGIEKLIFNQHKITTREIRNFCQILAIDPRKIIERDESISDIAAKRGIENIKVVKSRPPQIIETKESSLEFLADIIARRKKIIQQSSLAQKKAIQKPTTGQPQIAVKVDANLDLSSLSSSEIEGIIDDPKKLANILSSLPKADIKKDRNWGIFARQRLGKIQQILEISENRQKEEIFSRIALSITKMAPEIKGKLINDALLPALLEDREEGEILRFFPDADLACALASLKVAKISLPETLGQILDNLHLPERRKSTFFPLLEKELKKRGYKEACFPQLQEWRRDIKIKSLDYQRSFTESDFSFDINFEELQSLNVTLDSRDRQILRDIQSQLTNIDLVSVELRCLVNLIQLEENLEACRSFVNKIFILLRELIESERWTDLAFWLNHLRAMASTTSNRRPIARTLIREALSSLSSGEFIQHLVKKYHVEKDKKQGKKYLDVLGTLGEFAIPGFIQLLESEEDRSVRRTVIDIMVELAPFYDINNLSLYINHKRWYVVRNIVWLLGRIGQGGEHIIIQALNYQHPKVKKEAIRSLALIASPAAVEQITLLLESEDRFTRRETAEYLSCLPKKTLQPYVIRLLSRSDFIQKDTFVTLKLLDILGAVKDENVLELLYQLSFLRFSFWNWKLLRIGLKARSVLRIVKKSYFSNKSQAKKKF